MHVENEVIRVVIELKDAAICPVIERRIINDDGSVEYTRHLDEGAGYRFQGREHAALIAAAYAFVEAHLSEFVDTKLKAVAAVANAPAVLAKRVADEDAAEEKRKQELKRGLEAEVPETPAPSREVPTE